jgi:Uma2 family endonuclease
MATVIAQTPTALSTPIEREPEGHYEVIDGQIVEKALMSTREHLISARLVRAMNRFEALDRLGLVVFETLFVLDRNLHRRPDVAFVALERWPLERDVPTSNAWEVVPNLAIEVVGPTNRTDDDMEKIEEYFRAGARRVWFLHPRQRKVYDYGSPTSVHILQVGDELDGGEVLPGFRLPLTVLFQSEPAKA